MCRPPRYPAMQFHNPINDHATDRMKERNVQLCINRQRLKNQADMGNAGDKYRSANFSTRAQTSSTFMSSRQNGRGNRQ
jgi:hypothetical protein